MSKTPRLITRLLAFATFGAAAMQAGAATGPASAPASVRVEGAWARATAPGQNVGAVYFSILNGGSGADDLIAVESPAAARTEVHESRMQDGMMQMRPMPTVALAPRGRVEFSPGGLHVMLIGLKEPLVAGRTVALVLRFRHAGDLRTVAEIRSLQ